MYFSHLWSERSKNYLTQFPSRNTLYMSIQGPSDACAAKTVHRDLSEAGKQALLDKHNALRAKVARGEETNGPQPAAANMKKLVWNEELAVIAQRWADQCIFEHDTNREKTDGVWVGQNLYLHGSSTQYTYEEVDHDHNLYLSAHHEL